MHKLLFFSFIAMSTIHSSNSPEKTTPHTIPLGILSKGSGIKQYEQPGAVIKSGRYYRNRFDAQSDHRNRADFEDRRDRLQRKLEKRRAAKEGNQ